MADFNKPTVDSEYTQFPTEIRAAISAALSFLDGEHTNVPLKAKRWNSSAKIFEEYNGTQWMPMATEYKLPVDYNSLKNKPTPSSAVDDKSDTKFASSAAVKTAYDKGVEAKTAADNAQSTANSKQSPATTLAGYGIGNFKIENFVGNVNTLQTDGIYAVTQASRSQNLPVAGNGCHIQVIAGGDGRWCRQIAYIAYSTDMYERHQTSYQTDSWSAWVKIDSVDKLSKTDIIGEVAFFARTTPPSGWLKANGAAISRTTYAALFSVIGTTFGAGDGSTTFNLPDLRGEFLRCLDDGRNIDGGRRLGSSQGDEIKTHTINVPNSQWEGNVSGSWFFAERGNGNNNQPNNTITYTGGNETRPRNVALLACIKY